MKLPRTGRPLRHGKMPESVRANNNMASQQRLCCFLVRFAALVQTFNNTGLHLTVTQCTNAIHLSNKTELVLAGE